MLENKFMKTIFVLGVFLGLTLISSLLLSQNVFLLRQVKNALQASIERGGKVYYEQCLSCHQVDGGGVQNMNPPLTKTKWILGDKAQLIKVVLMGMTGKTEINGDTYQNVMAPHSDLSDQQIADVLTYVRNSFGNKASGVTALQVKTVRANTK
jgi:mono/diheme cytochrome c family protein